MRLTPSTVLLLIAVIFFVIVGIHADDAAIFKDVSVVGLGLAFFAASFFPFNRE